MKKAFFIFLIGAAAGAFAFYYVQKKQTLADSAQNPKATEQSKPTSAEKNVSLTERAREDAKAAKDAIANKLVEWHLTPDEIGSELAHTGQVVRTKAQSTGETIASSTSNARIITVIKTKYTVDSELKSRTIEIDCDKGDVTLRGTVTNPSLIAKAVGLALDTDGVTHVKSLLTVTPEKN
jgi:osmotically-inducible protein OsmY